MGSALEAFWSDLYQEVEKDPGFADSFQETLREMVKSGAGPVMSDRLKALAEVSKEELRPALERYREWLRGQGEVNRAARGLGDVQHYGDYAETFSGGQPIEDDDPPLTFADLEGIGPPDLTMIVENLKRDTMSPVEKSVVDIVDDDAIGRLDYVSVKPDDPDVVDDFEIDEPASPRLRTPAPSPTAEAPGDISEVHVALIEDVRGDKLVGSHPDLDWSKAKY